MTGNVLGFYCDFSILHEVWMSKSLQFLMLKLRAKKGVFFKCKKWLALIKNIWAIDKRKYYLSYYLPHWGQNKFKQLFFGGLQGFIYVLSWHISLFFCPTWTKIKILWFWNQTSCPAQAIISVYITKYNWLLLIFFEMLGVLHLKLPVTALKYLKYNVKVLRV